MIQKKTLQLLARFSIQMVKCVMQQRLWQCLQAPILAKEQEQKTLLLNQKQPAFLVITQAHWNILLVVPISKN